MTKLPPPGRGLSLPWFNDGPPPPPIPPKSAAKRRYCLDGLGRRERKGKGGEGGGGEGRIYCFYGHLLQGDRLRQFYRSYLSSSLPGRR